MKELIGNQQEPGLMQQYVAGEQLVNGDEHPHAPLMQGTEAFVGMDFDQLRLESTRLKQVIAVTGHFLGIETAHMIVDITDDPQALLAKHSLLTQLSQHPGPEQRIAKSALRALKIDMALHHADISLLTQEAQHTASERIIAPGVEPTMPEIQKRVLIEQPHDGKFNPDGSVNQQFYIGCPGVWHNQATGETVIYFKGTDPYFKDPADPAAYKGREAVSGIYGAVLKPDGAISFFDGEGEIPDDEAFAAGNTSARSLEDRSHARPVIEARSPFRGPEDPRFAKLSEIRARLEAKKVQALVAGETGEAAKLEGLIARIPNDPDATINFAAHGQEDIRLTQLAEYKVFLGAANTLNKDLLKPALAAADSLDEPIYGAYPELYIMGDPSRPETIVSLGDIGPVEYFKNVIFHPETVTIDGEPHIVVFMRKLPDIQAVTIPVKDLFALSADPQFRQQYWAEKLDPANLDKNTVMRPLHPWEGANHPNNPEGQIAGGAPPMKVMYRDAQTGLDREGWLMVYNSVPEYDEQGKPHGRLIGLALLDGQNPWKVVSRLPHPFVVPTTDAERQGRYDRDIVFATGAYIDNKDMLHILYTGGDINVSDASCDATQAIAYLSSYNEHGEKHQ